MTGNQANEILTQLAAAYPRFDMDTEASAFYRRMLAELDFRVAERAVVLWAKEEKWFPSVAEFRETCRRARRDLEAAKPTAHEPPRSSEIPEWVHIWFWQMQRTRLERQMLNTTSRQSVADRSPLKMRDFPQYETPGPDAYTIPEYEQIRSEWVEAGSPRLKNTAEVFAAVGAKS